MTGSSARRAVRGPTLTFVDDPFRVAGPACVRHEPDALVVMEAGRIVDVGPYGEVAARTAGDMPIDVWPDALIVPGFIDAHVHYPQTPIIGSWGARLIDWLERYTFPAEQRYADPGVASEAARVFLRECLRAGTTTAAVFCTVHPQSVDAFFEEAQRLGTRMIAGKVLMDRNAPEPLRDTARSGYDESKALIGRWHRRGRLGYAITPRFAATSSPEQLEAAGALRREFPDTLVQSHVSENPAEVAWVRSLFPDCSGYLDVYDRYGLLGPGAIYGHGVHLTEAELARCHETGTAIAHCPTSNLFLGSGCLDVGRVARADRPVRVALATDLGAGTSFSALQTMNEAYKVSQLAGGALDVWQAWWMATRGGARALGLDGVVGSIERGVEADLVVLDLESTPVIDYRMRHCGSLEEALFVQMTMGDDRAIRATYVAGKRVYDRDAATAAD
ncbi:MAG: guanine deaminase [Burkholderiales bacterium]